MHLSSSGKAHGGSAALDQCPGELIDHNLAYLTASDYDEETYNKERDKSKQTVLERDLSCLTRTCRRLYDIANPLLYRINNIYSNSALEWASIYNVPDVFRRAHKIGVKIRDHKLALLHNAAIYGNIEVVETMLSLAKLDNFLWLAGSSGSPDPVSPFTVTINARSDRHLLFIQTLIEHGADPSCPSGKGDTPLHHAVATVNIEAVELLLGAGADVLADMPMSPP